MNNTTRTVLASELSFLRTIIALHSAKIAVAAEAMDAADEAFEAAWGFSAVEAPHYAVGYANARAAYVALREESGFYWTCSRVQDLALMVEGSADGQLRMLAAATLAGCCVHVVGLGDMPQAHASVAPFIAQTLGYAQAA